MAKVFGDSTINLDRTMPTYEPGLIATEAVAEGTVAFYFEKPPGFQFKRDNPSTLIRGSESRFSQMNSTDTE